MSLAEVFNLGFNFLFEYYHTEAWNENKIRKENDETIKHAVLSRLNSLIKCFNGR